MNDAIRTDNKFAAIPNWVIESGVTPQAGWLYVWLKKYADYNTNDAFPSRKTLATKLGLAKAASVDRYISELETLGALKVAPRWDKDKDGRQTSNLYTVVTANPRVTPEATPVPYRGQGASPTGDGASPAQGTRTKNQVTQNHLNSSSPSADEVFGRFWAVYPKKVSKQAARKVWDRTVKTVNPEEIIAGAKTYAAWVKAENKEKKFMKDPDGWLNAGKWEDELEVRTVKPAYDPWSQEAYSA